MIKGSEWVSGTAGEVHTEFKLIWDLQEPFLMKGKCVSCCKVRIKGVGIVCGNFFTGRGPYTPCHMMWCRGCYADDSDKVFPQGEMDV